MTARRRLDIDQRIRRHDLLVGVLRAEAGPVIELDTARRTAIHTFIRDHMGAHGYAPTVREIQVAVGLRSPSTVNYQLKQLVDAGVIRHDPDKPRSIVLLRGGCAHCGCPGSHPDGAL